MQSVCKADLPGLSSASGTTGFVRHAIPMAMDGFGKRLAHARKLRGMKVREVAAHFGVSASTVTQWEHGLTEPTASRLLELPKLLNVSALWLLYNVGLPEPNGNGNIAVQPQYVRSARLPRITAMAATTDHSVAIENTDDYVAAIDGSTASGDFAINIWDQSNAPAMTVGDYVIIRPTKSVQPGDYVLVSVGQDRAPLLGQIGRTDTGWEVVHTNRLWGRRGLTSIDEIIGVLVAHVRTFPR